MNSLVLGVGGFMVGVWYSLSTLKVDGSITLVFVCLLVFIICYWMILLFSEKVRFGNMILICALGVSLGLFCGVLDIRKNPEVVLPEELLKEKVSVSGCIIAPVDSRLNRTNVFLKVSEISDARFPQEIDLRIRVSLPKVPEVSYGQCIKAQGKLSVPEDFETDSGKTFGYKDYLWKDYISYQLGFVRSFEIVEMDENSSRVVAFLEKTKRWFENRLHQLLQNPYGGLLAGELLGSRSMLSQKIQDDFRISGVIHVVVLSGYNVALIVGILGKFLSLISRRVSIFGSILGVIAFAILVGGGATVVRASLMGLLVVYAGAIGRRYSAMRALIIVLSLMVLWSPRILLYDIGFQMSALATAGMILFSQRIQIALPVLVPKALQMRESLAATTAAQLAVLPILILKIGEVSAVSLLANMIILFMVPISMLLGFVAVCVSFLSFPVGFVLAWITQGTLWFQISLANFFANLPFGIISFPNSSRGIVLMVWFFLMIFVYSYFPGSEKK